MMALEEIRMSLRAAARPEGVPILQRFFKTGPGEYGEGDTFLGVRVPDTRKLLPRTDRLEEGQVKELLHSCWHEERLLGLLTLVRRFHRGNEETRRAVVGLYRQNLSAANNWDLVDSSAPGILGLWVAEHPADKTILCKLVRSQNLWERRIAVLATLSLIRHGAYDLTLEFCERLLTDPHDLMHKACGWMLREAGQRDEAVLTDFLQNHADVMPRTMLRYAIEKRAPAERRQWLAARTN